MVKHLTCFKCHDDTATLTYEENRIYKISCPCGCEYSFEHSSMKCAEEYHLKMLELYGEIDRSDALQAENARLTALNTEAMELTMEKLRKECDGFIVKDTYTKGKNAGFRKAIVILQDCYEALKAQEEQDG